MQAAAHNAHCAVGILVGADAAAFQNIGFCNGIAAQNVAALPDAQGCGALKNFLFAAGDIFAHGLHQLHHMAALFNAGFYRAFRDKSGLSPKKYRGSGK